MTRFIQMPNYKVAIGTDPRPLSEALHAKNYSQILALVDEHTEALCLPLLKGLDIHQVIRIPSGESAKNIATCTSIWQQMLAVGADRQSLLINLGGGVIGDMGGFCAATFKRGMDFIQVPTTLLSQVDASVGGKLAIDFSGYKNIVGVFQDPRLVWVNPAFLSTLPERQLLNGMMEMYKHGLIGQPTLYHRLQELKHLDLLSSPDTLFDAIQVKGEVVLEDPFEKGRRKVLNLGHSLGHAVESYLLEGSEEWLHGECIAAGLIMENFISRQKGWLSPVLEQEVLTFITTWYQLPSLPAEADEHVMRYLWHDKKNVGQTLIFSLLRAVGEVTSDSRVTPEEALTSLQYYRSITA